MFGFAFRAFPFPDIQGYILIVISANVTKFCVRLSPSTCHFLQAGTVEEEVLSPAKDRIFPKNGRYKLLFSGIFFGKTGTFQTGV